MSRHRFGRTSDAESNGKPEGQEEEVEDNRFGDDPYLQRSH